MAARPSALLTGLAACIVGALVASEVAGWLPDAQGTDAGCSVTCVDLGRLTVTRHRFLPDPLCPLCGVVPDDDAELARITLASRPKPSRETYRVRDVLPELDQLRRTYVDEETGLIRTINHDTLGGLVLAGAMMPLRSHDADEPGIGRARSYRTSELTAILEALERYGGVEPGGKRTVVRARYAAIADRALDPRTLGLHPAESYDLPGFPFRPFDEDQECRWCWGYSFGRGEPVLVPEACAYFRAHRREPVEMPFVYEISNGCALGSCLEEAILHGLLEVAERDAFLLTWYARMPAPRLDLGSAVDRTVPLQAAAIAAETGYEVLAFDTTVEHGIPCVWTMAVHPGDPGPDAPKMVCAAGAHPSLEHAVLNGLSELGPILVDLMRRFPNDADRARRMVADPALVATMPDHSTLYGAVEAFDRLGFLTGSGRVRRLDEPPLSRREAFGNEDLSDDLREAVKRFLDSWMDVVVVDQTAPEHRAGGFSCVKVLVPGSVPMTFGYHHRRTVGLPRLGTVPKLLGHRPEPLPYEDLNPHPHPFP
jgi:ribosomal protein S12 methylthiotransferase accessory factor